MKNRFLIVTLLTVVVAILSSACAMKEGPTLDSKERRETYLVLVNKEHEIPENWTNKVAIYEMVNSFGKKLCAEEETSEQFKLLQSDLMSKGIQIEADSAFRSLNEQEQEFDDFAAKHGKMEAEKYLASPKNSENLTGLAIDIFTVGKGRDAHEKEDLISDRETVNEIAAVLPEYGFILRYPEGREDSTGFPYEPWHLRYIGDTEIATEIMQSGMTLEDYLGE